MIIFVFLVPKYIYVYIFMIIASSELTLCILAEFEKPENAGGWFYHWPKGYKITKKIIVLFNSDTCWLSNDIEITFKF